VWDYYYYDCCVCVGEISDLISLCMPKKCSSVKPSATATTTSNLYEPHKHKHTQKLQLATRPTTSNLATQSPFAPLPCDCGGTPRPEVHLFTPPPDPG